MKATEDWVYSGMISFKMPVVGREKNPQKFFIIVISICFSYTGNVFRVIELEADENHSYFWKRQALHLRAQRLRGAQNNVRWGPDHPPLNVILRAPHSKISAMGPEFLATVSKFQAHPQFITWFLPPYSLFLTLTRLRSFSPHGGGRFTIAPSQTSPSSPGHMMHAMTSHETNVRPGFAMPEDFFPRCLTNENIQNDVRICMWPNPQDRVDKNTEEQ